MTKEEKLLQAIESAEAIERYAKTLRHQIEAIHNAAGLLVEQINAYIDDAGLEWVREGDRPYYTYDAQASDYQKDSRTFAIELSEHPKLKIGSTINVRGKNGSVKPFYLDDTEAHPDGTIEMWHYSDRAEPKEERVYLDIFND